MDQQSKSESLRTLAEVCKLLNISLPTAKRWIYSGKLLAHRIGGRWMVPDEEIRKFMTYRLTRELPLIFANAPLEDVEVNEITDLLAHALRQVGAPVRADGLRKFILGKVPSDPLFWRYLKRVLSKGAGGE